jgi:hypothetical protein
MTTEGAAALLIERGLDPAVAISSLHVVSGVGISELNVIVHRLLPPPSPIPGRDARR